MFPWVYDFKWEPVHLVFLNVFGIVLVSLISLLVLAVVRTVRILRQGKAEAVRWAEDFHDLPAASKACRHELTGEVGHRTCSNGFDCRTCKGHEAFLSASAGAPAVGSPPDVEVFGFPTPSDRLYHRGHTWVRPEPDGTVTVGLDAFAARLIGKPDQVILPDAGTWLVVNGTAWRVRKGKAEARILSPVDGEVVAQGEEAGDWILRVRPAGELLDNRHLLKNGEIRPWIVREMERLQGVLSRDPGGTSLADGGMPVEDLSSAIPEERRDEVLGEMLLEP